MGVINREFTNLFIDSNFSDNIQRKKLLELFEKLEYQKVSDSPTLKHYTDWTSFETLNLIPKIGNKINIILDEIISDLKDFNIIRVINNNADYELIDSYTNKLIDPTEHKLVALTLALSKKIVIEKPGNYLIYHLTTEPEIISPLNIEINASDGNFNIMYLTELKNEKALNTSVISITSNENANVNLNIISLGNNGYVFNYTKSKVKGSISTSIFSSGGATSHVEYYSELYEKASAKFLTRGLGVNNDRITIVSRVLHKEGRSSSIGKMKGIASMSSRVILRGVATVSETAHDSSTEITGKSLILSRDAAAVVVPMLEVKTGRVNLAKHSASVSKVLEDHIFYLQNRGLSKKEAEGLIIREFLYNEEDPSLLKNYILRIIQNLGY
ncbi:MAG: SufD family Fe-S cluster assembly protein [Sulfolobaceae archaeon]